MGYREEWKMLHVLNTSKNGKQKERLKNELQKIINRYKLFATPEFCND
jgi:hypothetical protein